MVGSAGAPTVRSEVDELTAALCELAGQIHAATAELVRLLGRLDAVDGWQGVGIRSLGHWASIYLGIDLRTAAQQARVGRQLEALPAIAAAAGAGELGWSKLRLVTKVVEPDTEARWLELAREMSVGQLGRVVAAYRRASDTDDPDRSENHRERRGIWLFDEPDGLVRVTGLLEPEDAAVLRAALAAHAELRWRQAPEPQSCTNGEDTSPDGDPDEAGPTAGAPARASEVDPTLAARDPAASRRVDALVSLARAALAAGEWPDDGDDLTQVLLVIDHDVLTLGREVGRCQLHDGSAIGTHTAQRLCCDARIQPLIHSGGQPLALGRSRRLVNRAQRRALRFRDGPGCAFPSCAGRHVDAHHLVAWERGGATDLANLVLLCRHHHRLLHEGGYRAALIDNRPRFFRPDGTPLRPPDPPDPDPARGSDELRRRHRADGKIITARTAEAGSGGAPWWSPQHALDALVS
jgi:Domain of unknown function (DUF222)/HNH endonuclease